MAGKRWIDKGYDESLVESLRNDLNIHPVILRLLVQRGIYRYEDAKLYFRPSMDHLHDPFLMKDMDRAVDRISTALKDRQKILVYGDYDVDGTTSVALMYSFLRNFSDDLTYYLPDRYKEGYGISMQGVDFAAENGISLIIALDCGIKAIEQVDYAASKGIDFIICDHHRPGADLPKAVAVLDPKREDCPYPYKELSGCGIGFKLCQGLAQKLNHPEEELNKLLDLVVVSIASDIVPITGENRVLAYFGLQQINSLPRPGLRALKFKAGITNRLDITNIVFFLGPRINAAGRMNDATLAVKLLVAEDMSEAEPLAALLHQFNDKRKGEDEKITSEAIEMLEKDPENGKRKSTVVYKEDWHKGVIGIVASRLIEQYYRPTVILTRSAHEAVGSARSVKGFDVYNALKECSGMMNKFGGHMYAAGLSFDLHKLDAFKAQFEEVVSAGLEPDMMTPEIEIDAPINLDDIGDSFFRVMRQMAPFGPGNLSPVFRMSDIRDAGNSKIVGKKHLKLDLTNGKKRINGIAFGQSESFLKINDAKKFDICFSLEENEWNGRRSLQLNVKDIAVDS